MSWASVVISGTISQDHRELYSALEVRTQALWLLAHRISKVRPGLHGMNLPQLEILASLFERAVLALLTVDDPTINERILRLHDGIISTSRIEKRIQIARGNIDGLRVVIMAREDRRRAHFEFVIEFLLFIIASLQLLPLAFSTPITGLWRYLIILFWLLFLAAFVLIRWKVRR